VIIVSRPNGCTLSFGEDFLGLGNRAIVTNFVFLISNGRSGRRSFRKPCAGIRDVAFISNIEDRIPTLPPSAGRFNNPLYRRVPRDNA
jgi:hypothetical protein